MQHGLLTMKCFIASLCCFLAFLPFNEVRRGIDGLRANDARLSPFRLRPPKPPAFAFGYISTAAGGSTNGNSHTTVGADTTSAKLIVLGVADYSAATAGTPTDSQSNTWKVLNTYTASGSVRIRLFYCAYPKTNASHTFTYSVTGSYPSIGALWFSGQVPSEPFDKQNGGSGTSTTLATGSVTPTFSNELLVTAVGNNNSDTSSIDSSFNLTAQVSFANAQRFALGMAYKIQTSAGAENPTWTLASGANANAATIASFKLFNASNNFTCCEY